MTTRRDADELTRATRRSASLAVAELERIWPRLRGSGPEAIRDALLEIVPALVVKYGEVAASAAAEWYEAVRAGQVQGRFSAVVAATVDEAAVQGSVRYAAGALFTETPDSAVAALAGTVQRQVSNAARRTVFENVRRDPRRPRFARVPSGASTCAFCTMQSSRGFVYASEATAGMHDHFHDGCDCRIVPEWSREPELEGYNPDRMRAMYDEARRAAGSGDPDAILAEMRRIYADDLTDGVQTSK